MSKIRAFSAILGKGPWPKVGENDRLNIEIGRKKRQRTEHQNWEKLMTKNITRVAKYIAKIKVFFIVCQATTSVIVSSSGPQKIVKKKKKKRENRPGIGEKGWLFSIGNGAEIRPLEKCRKSPENLVSAFSEPVDRF